jgi:hypothetical protein
MAAAAAAAEAQWQRTGPLLRCANQECTFNVLKASVALLQEQGVAHTAAAIEQGGTALSNARQTPRRNLS